MSDFKYLRERVCYSLNAGSTGTCLATFDDPARRTFEMYAYADYARLN